MLPAFSLLIATSLGDAGVSLETKVGQMIMVGFRGTAVANDHFVVRDIRAGRIGGVVLYNRDVPTGSDVRNIISPDQLRGLIKTLQGHAPTPLFVAVDQEGGRVRRLKDAFGLGPRPSARDLGRQKPSNTGVYYGRVAGVLGELGINMNFAPVVDLDLNPDNPVIGKHERSFGRDAGLVIRHARAAIDAHRKHGVIAVLKHFPGHGSSAGDSHEGLPDVSRVWKPVELRPYAVLIKEERCDAVMTAHIVNSQLDPKHPATLSRPTLHGELRAKMKFGGIIISDDLQMQAIRSKQGLREAVRLAVDAGVDVLMFANNSVYEPEIASRVHLMILDLVAQGHLDRGRIDAAYARIRRLKAPLL